MRKGKVYGLKKGECLIPDILAHAAGVRVSYFKAVRKAQRFYGSVEEVNTRLERLIPKACEEVHRCDCSINLDHRIAAFTMAIPEVRKSTALRGL